MPLCDHEEADTRLIVHNIVDALNKGQNTFLVLVRIVDTDVVAILIGKFYFIIFLMRLLISG